MRYSISFIKAEIHQLL